MSVDHATLMILFKPIEQRFSFKIETIFLSIGIIEPFCFKTDDVMSFLFHSNGNNEDAAIQVSTNFDKFESFLHRRSISKTFRHSPFLE